MLDHKTIVVTGGFGFIGSNFIHFINNNFKNVKIYVIDNLSYAANKQNLPELSLCNKGHEQHTGYNHNTIIAVFCDLHKNHKQVSPTVNTGYEWIFKDNIVDAIFHFAAESHVDNSITGPEVFVDSNVKGTFKLLECARKHSVKRFIHISTDEVYGDLPTADIPKFKETDIMKPSSVYSATKAASDMLVLSYKRTYNMDVVITRCCNNYGPRQHNEKLIPTIISNAINDKPIPVYGKGNNIREWIYVDDHCLSILDVYYNGVSGEIYNIGSGEEIQNIELVKIILDKLNKNYNCIEYVSDRPGHDFRYALDCSKLLDLKTQKIKNCTFRDYAKVQQKFTRLSAGLDKTIEWYKDVLAPKNNA